MRAWTWAGNLAVWEPQQLFPLSVLHPKLATSGQVGAERYVSSFSWPPCRLETTIATTGTFAFSLSPTCKIVLRRCCSSIVPACWELVPPSPTALFQSALRPQIIIGFARLVGLLYPNHPSISVRARANIISFGEDNSFGLTSQAFDLHDRHAIALLVDYLFNTPQHHNRAKRVSSRWSLNQDRLMVTICADCLYLEDVIGNIKPSSLPFAIFSDCGNQLHSALGADSKPVLVLLLLSYRPSQINYLAHCLDL